MSTIKITGKSNLSIKPNVLVFILNMEFKNNNLNNLINESKETINNLKEKLKTINNLKIVESNFYINKEYKDDNFIGYKYNSNLEVATSLKTKNYVNILEILSNYKEIKSINYQFKTNNLKKYEDSLITKALEDASRKVEVIKKYYKYDSVDVMEVKYNNYNDARPILFRAATLDVKDINLSCEVEVTYVVR